MEGLCKQQGKTCFCIEMHVYVPKYNFVSEHIIEDSYRMQRT